MLRFALACAFAVFLTADGFAQTTNSAKPTPSVAQKTTKAAATRPSTKMPPKARVSVDNRGLHITRTDVPVRGKIGIETTRFGPGGVEKAQTLIANDGTVTSYTKGMTQIIRMDGSVTTITAKGTTTVAKDGKKTFVPAAAATHSKSTTAPTTKPTSTSKGNQR